MTMRARPLRAVWYLRWSEPPGYAAPWKTGPHAHLRNAMPSHVRIAGCCRPSTAAGTLERHNPFWLACGPPARARLRTGRRTTHRAIRRAPVRGGLARTANRRGQLSALLVRGSCHARRALHSGTRKSSHPAIPWSKKKAPRAIPWELFSVSDSIDRNG